MRRRLQSQQGQSLPLVVLFLLVILGIIALVLDGGFAFAQKRRMQNAADSAVLSSAIIITKGEYRDAIVRQAATAYAQANGAQSADVRYLDASGNLLPNPTNGMVPTNATSLRVTARVTFPTFFARLVGVSTMTASAQARAKTLPGAMPQNFPGLAPLSVPENFYRVCSDPGDRCDLWDSSYAQAWGIPPNQYKALIDLSLGTAGNLPQKVSEWTQYGYPGIVDAGIYVPTISGNYGNNVALALRQRITANPGGVDPDGVVWGTIDIAIWDAWEPANKTTGTPMRVRVTKFGRFKIRMTDVFGSHTYGHFIDYVIPGHDRGENDEPAGPTIIVLGG